MILPNRSFQKKLSIPFKMVNWSCRAAKNSWIGVLLIPLPLVALGIALLLISGEAISRGMWLVMLWTSMTFALIYYSQFRIRNSFSELAGIIPETSEAQKKVDEVRVRIFNYSNNRNYYISSAITMLVILPLVNLTFIQNYSSIYVQIWCWVFFVFSTFVGGYGLAYGLAFIKIIREIVDAVPYALNPYHPDRFMGLKPLGNLCVAVALGVSSASLVFPLIFEAIHGDLADFLGYFAFLAIFFAILVSFFGPLFLIKGKIEREKFAALLATEDEYQRYLKDYKRTPSEGLKEILRLLRIEKRKLDEIRLFPFETKMVFQFVVSIVLPVVMFFLQLQLKK
ncbi:MAG: hypothetical protein JSS40_03670 [Proteobacteria bacterium]|nr:hypothetical protein [Pseudomonadota bacterium]